MEWGIVKRYGKVNWRGDRAGLQLFVKVWFYYKAPNNTRKNVRIFKIKNVSITEAEIYMQTQLSKG